MDPTHRTAPDLGAAASGGRAAGTARSRLDPAGPAVEVDPGTPPPPHPSGEALHRATALIAELREYASYFIATKIDGIKVTVRNVGIYAVLGIVGLIVMSAVVTTSVVLLLVGLAMGIGKIFDPDQYWVGGLAVGLLVLGGLAAGVIFGMRWLTNTSRAALVKKYESRQRQQRTNFGHDVRGREPDGADAVA